MTSFPDTCDQRNHTFVESAIIPAPIDKVWSFIGNFGDAAAWHPMIASSQWRDDAHTVRILQVKDGPLVEEVQLPAPKYKSRYMFLNAPIPVLKQYGGVISLKPITHGVHAGQTFVTIKGRAYVRPEDEDQARATLRLNYTVGLENLATLCSSE